MTVFSPGAAPWGRPLIFVFIAWVWTAGVSASFAQEPDVTVHIQPNGAVEEDVNGDFIITEGEAISWDVTVTVVNPTDVSFADLTWTNQYDEVLQFSAVDADGGDVTWTERSSMTQIAWTLSSLKPRTSHRLSFRLTPQADSRSQEFHYARSDRGCRAWDGGAVFSFQIPGRPGWRTITFLARLRCVGLAPPWMTIGLTTRKDWRVLLPGDYASPATEIEVAGNRDVSVLFSGFDGMGDRNGRPVPGIETSYSWGDTIAEAESRGWMPGERLESWHFAESSELEAGIRRTLWQRIELREEHRALEYAENGTITFVLRNNDVFVSP